MPTNTYWLYHGLIDAIYLLIVMIGVWPILFIGKWKKKTYGKKAITLDVIRHIILPILFCGFSSILGIPLWVVFYFVKDLFMVIVISSIILAGTGVYKMVWRYKSRVWR